MTSIYYELYGIVDREVNEYETIEIDKLKEKAEKQVGYMVSKEILHRHLIEKGYRLKTGTCLYTRECTKRVEQSPKQTEAVTLNINIKMVLNLIQPYLDENGIMSIHDFEKLFVALTVVQRRQLEELLKKEGIAVAFEQTHGIKQVIPLKSTRHIDELKHLSNEQLCTLYQQGDQAALEALIVNNQGLVRSRVIKYSGRYKHKLDDEDLIEYGNMGVMQAAKRYKAIRDAKFTTYSMYWINQSILRNIADYGFTIRIPVHLFEQVNKFVRVASRNMGVSTEELADLLEAEGMSRHTFEEVRKVYTNIVSPASLNKHIGDEEESELGAFICDFLEPTVEEQVEANCLKEILQQLLETLSDRERRILTLRFGLEDGKYRTLEEVGKEMNVTRERIRQIEAKALKRLNHHQRKKKLRGYIA